VNKRHIRVCKSPHIRNIGTRWRGMSGWLYHLGNAVPDAIGDALCPIHDASIYRRLIYHRVVMLVDDKGYKACCDCTTQRCRQSPWE
jgi:hypothetical protein